MSRFLQLHLLTFYPPSNLNRDDTGRPKTAIIGGTTRLRISSQALKRAWRTNDTFRAVLHGHLATRTQRLGEDVQQHLLGKGLSPAEALRIARAIATAFGKPKPDADKHPARTEQLAFISDEERAAALTMADRMAADATLKPDPSDLLRQTDTAVDLAMFGRMLADNPDYNREAAVQVAHAITTHRVTIEDDYYVAVDDLKKPAEDMGAGFIGEQGFGSGVFYLYLCVDRALLAANLGSDAGLSELAIAALVEAAATVSPTGKQNSFASRAYAHYILAERGDAQPRTLAGAFATPGEGDIRDGSVAQLREWRAALNQAYGAPAASAEMHARGAGSLADILSFCQAA